MPGEQFYKQLVQRFKNNEASDEELLVFYQLLGENKLDEYLGEAIEQEFEQLAATTTHRSGKVKKLALWKKLTAVAAAILVIIAGAVVYVGFIHRPVEPPKIVNKPVINDIAPGGNKATLTLADGTTISLDAAQDGLLAAQGTTNIVKDADGRLTYNAKGVATDNVVYNTLTTPVAGQYRLTLADGTIVWLNASSSLHYPNRFEGKERRVKLTGEGYFEVKHSDSNPFVVEVNDVQVRDLGTEFNINAYPDEKVMQTTLVKGLASVEHNKQTVLLQPGKAALTSAGKTEVKTVDVDYAAAWKEGVFLLTADIQTIMRQVKRWYNVDVVYKGNLSDQKFSGQISRSEPLSKLLKILELTNGVHFSVEGNTITVMP